MGNCCGLCYKGEPSSYEDLRRPPEDTETMRKRLAEAAEKRIAEQQTRGLKDAESAMRHQRALQIKKLEEEATNSRPTLRWQMN